jgi:hypothetical protein
MFIVFGWTALYHSQHAWVFTRLNVTILGSLLQHALNTYSRGENYTRIDD